MLEVYDRQIAFVMPYFNFPVNWTIASTWIVMAVLMLVSFLATRNLKTGDKVSHWQTAMEVMVKAIYGQISEMTKANRAMTYLPFIGTLFLFILTCNLLTLVPEKIHRTVARDAAVQRFKRTDVDGRDGRPFVRQCVVGRHHRFGLPDAGAVHSAFADAGVRAVHGDDSSLHFRNAGADVRFVRSRR